MRALVVSVLCSGCLISAPEGAVQSWPPPLGLTVDAVVAGDLDANGSTEIVVFGSGDDNQAGMYYLAGGTDFTLNQTTPVESFSRFVPASFTAPLAVDFVAGAAPRIHVAHSEAMLTLTVLTNTLGVADTAASTLVGGGALVWTNVVDFPGGMPHPSISNGTNIDHFSTELTDPRPIPPPGGPTWNQAQLATAYTATGSQVVVVATSGKIERATIPTMPGSMFVYQTVRDGPPWVAQTAFDFDGDGREEIVGFDLQSHEVCVVDPGMTAIPTTKGTCISLLSNFTGPDVTLFVGQNLSMGAGPDILVAQTSDTQTNYTLIEDYVYTNGLLTTTKAPLQIPFPGPARGRTVVVTDSPTFPYAALTFGSDGTVTCALGPCRLP